MEYVSLYRNDTGVALIIDRSELERSSVSAGTMQGRGLYERVKI